MTILLADSGATKCEWAVLNNQKTETVFTQGLSPYFLNGGEIVQIIKKELLPSIKNVKVEEIHFYGTGLANPKNADIIKNSLSKLFPDAKVYADHDLMAAARALCGNNKGIACNLGTGSFVCYYDGKDIIKENPGLGYVLGDEGSGTYLGKKVIQHYLYNTFDEELRYKFDAKFVTTRLEILENVYKKPLPNKYLATFAIFLAENRGHYMIENIIEDGLNDFFFQHLCKYNESWNYPIHFVGSIAYAFRDVVTDLCSSYEFERGKILRNPMEGLIDYHRKIKKSKTISPAGRKVKPTK